MFNVEIYRGRRYEYTLSEHSTLEEALLAAKEFNATAPEGVVAEVVLPHGHDPVVLTDKYPGDDAFGEEPISILGDAKYCVNVYELKGGEWVFQFCLGTFYTETEARFVADEYNITADESMSAEVVKAK